MWRISTRMLPIAFAPSVGQMWMCVDTYLFVCWFLARFLKIEIVLFFFFFPPSFPLLPLLPSVCLAHCQLLGSFFFPLAWGCSTERHLFFVLCFVLFFVLIQSFRGDILSLTLPVYYFCFSFLCLPMMEVSGGVQNETPLPMSVYRKKTQRKRQKITKKAFVCEWRAWISWRL